MARIHRWQLSVALLGVLLLVGILSLSSYHYSTALIPTYGGTYREGMAGAPRTFNPLLSSFNLVDRDVTALLFRGLGRLDEQGRVVPDLASGWEISPDARVYTVHLGLGHRWQDGTPVTVEDVLFTFRTLQDPKFPGDPALKHVWQSVIIERVDAHTVRFTLAEPFAPFLDQLTMGLLPAHVWQGTSPAAMERSPLNQHPVGNGPFVLSALTPVSLTLKPNLQVLSPKPYIARVRFLFYPDESSVLEAYRRGEIDALTRIRPADLPTLAARKDTQLFFSPMPGYTILLPNLQNPNVPFFQEKAVRQALLYGLDRKRLVREILHGMGVVAHTPFLPHTWAYTDAVATYAYDPDRARHLLEKAGWVDQNGDGIREKKGVALRFILVGDDTPEQKAMLAAIAGMWKEIGVQAIPRPVTFAGLVRDFLVPRTFEMALVSWTLGGDPDPYPLWHSSQTSGRGQNYVGWVNPEADALMEEARRTPDLNRRIPLYHRFQQIFARELPGLLLYHPLYGYAVRDRVKNVTVGPLYEPWDRFRTFPNWYIRVKRVPVTAVTPTP